MESIDSNIIFLGLLIIVVGVGIIYFINKQKNSDPVDSVQLTKDYENTLNTKLNELKDKFATDLGLVNKSIGAREQDAKQILQSQQQLYDSLTGSKRFGVAGELLLENAFRNSGLTEGREFIINKNYQKDGTTLFCEFAIIHPTGLVLPIDSHWPKTAYEILLDMRKQLGNKTQEQIEQENKKLKEIVKQYENKAKEVKSKYADNAASMDFSIVYVPSESLHFELSTFVNDDKELFLSKIQREYKVTLMGPSTFHAFISSILLGFNTVSSDQKAKKFIQHWNTLTTIVKNHMQEIETINNKIQGLMKASDAFERSGNKLNAEIDRIKSSIDEVEENKNA